MTSLSYVTEHIKLVGKWAAIGIGVIILLVFLFKFLFFMKERLFPTPLPKPTVMWGKLPPLSFPQSQFANQFTYKINTLSGKLPTFPDRMVVNLLATPTASLNSLQNAKDVVNTVGFDQDEVRISESIYQWINPEPPQKKLKYDIVSKNFVLRSNYLFDNDITKPNQIDDEQVAQRAAQDFFTQLKSFPADFDTTKSTLTFFAIQNGNLMKTTSLSNAQIVRVDFFQKDINNYAIYYPQYTQSPMYVLVGGDGTEVVESNYLHAPISDTSSTYPIITANEAFTLLQKGEGYIAAHSGSNTTVLIQDVKIGYYLDENYQNYLMPIYIFQGNDDFVGYVSAITAAWIHK